MALLTEDIRVRRRDTPRTGTVKVLHGLDWASVKWDDTPEAGLQLVHTSHLEVIEDEDEA